MDTAELFARGTRDWLKMKNPAAPAVQREAEEDWDRRQKTPPVRTGL